MEEEDTSEGEDPGRASKGADPIGVVGDLFNGGAIERTMLLREHQHLE